MCNKYSIKNYPPLRVKNEGTLSGASPLSASFPHSKNHRIFRLASALLLSASLLLATSCETDGDAPDNGGGMTMELNIRTRAITSGTYTYEVGSAWENYIDIAGGDYKIYFFTNNQDDAAATDDSERNTLIAEFVPTDLDAVEGSTYTQYTLTGKVDDDIAAYSGFKVVVLANWGTYPTVTAGKTTIDALVEDDNATFYAENLLSGVDATHLIPFFGVREYSNVEWKKGWRTTLSGDISLLRAVAKVEVILNADDSDIEGFDSVVLNRYNSTGYCAPSGVYLKGDYDHGSWEQDFVDALHLVGNSNDTDQDGRAFTLYKTTSDDGQEMWVGYLPEYDNTSSSATELYSYLQVNFNGDSDYEDTRIYFANYANGLPSSNADYDICRNYLYRFYVTVISGEGFRVRVNEWEEYFDNDYTFGGER